MHRRHRAEADVERPLRARIQQIPFQGIPRHLLAGITRALQSPNSLRRRVDTDRLHGSSPGRSDAKQFQSDSPSKFLGSLIGRGGLGRQEPEVPGASHAQPLALLQDHAARRQHRRAAGRIDEVPERVQRTRRPGAPPGRRATGPPAGVRRGTGPSEPLRRAAPVDASAVRDGRRLRVASPPGPAQRWRCGRFANASPRAGSRAGCSPCRSPCGRSPRPRAFPPRSGAGTGCAHRCGPRSSPVRRAVVLVQQIEHEVADHLVLALGAGLEIQRADAGLDRRFRGVQSIRDGLMGGQTFEQQRQDLPLARRQSVLATQRCPWCAATEIYLIWAC